MYRESDLIGRLRLMIEVSGGLGLIGLGLLFMLLLLLMVTNKRTALLGAFLMAGPFSGAIWPVMDTGSTLFRWAVMFFFSGTIVFGIRKPGWPTVCLGFASALMLPMAFASPDPIYTFQRSGLFFVLAVPMAVALAHHFSTIVEIMKFLRIFMYAAGLYAVMAIAFLPHLRTGERFSGITSGAPLFVMTGGLMLPVALWGAMRAGKGLWRTYCIAVAVIISLTNVLSAQRTGTLAGFVGCLPLLARFGIRRVLAAVAVLILGLGVLWLAMNLVPAQAEYVHHRWFESDTSGRIEIWEVTLAACLEQPWIGEGMGSSEARAGLGVHSAYFAAWLDGGIVVLLLILLAYGGTVLLGFRLAARASTAEMRDLSRLMLGLIITCMVEGVFEEAFFSPSNFAAFVGMATCVMTVRLVALERQAVLVPQVPDWTVDAEATVPAYLGGAYGHGLGHG